MIKLILENDDLQTDYINKNRDLSCDLLICYFLLILYFSLFLYLQSFDLIWHALSSLTTEICSLMSSLLRKFPKNFPIIYIIFPLQNVGREFVSI